MISIFRTLVGLNDDLNADARTLANVPPSGLRVSTLRPRPYGAGLRDAAPSALSWSLHLPMLDKSIQCCTTFISIGGNGRDDTAKG